MEIRSSPRAQLPGGNSNPLDFRTVYLDGTGQRAYGLLLRLLLLVLLFFLLSFFFVPLTCSSKLVRFESMALGTYFGFGSKYQFARLLFFPFGS